MSYSTPTARNSARESPRVRYPETREPVLEAGSAFFRVLDLAESGLRFHAERGLLVRLGEPFVGRVVFPSGTPAVQIAGFVVRVTRTDIAVSFLPQGRISRQTIEAELRHQRPSPPVPDGSAGRPRPRVASERPAAPADARRVEVTGRLSKAELPTHRALVVHKALPQRQALPQRH